MRLVQLAFKYIFLHGKYKIQNHSGKKFAKMNKSENLLIFEKMGNLHIVQKRNNLMCIIFIRIFKSTYDFALAKYPFTQSFLPVPLVNEYLY